MVGRTRHALEPTENLGLEPKGEGTEAHRGAGSKLIVWSIPERFLGIVMGKPLGYE